jgi:MFS family permease
LAAAHAARTIDNATYKQNGIYQQQQTQIQSNLPNDNEYFHYKILSEICSLLRINVFRILIISMIFIWSLDETNFLFLSDLLKSTGQSEQRSTLLIAITGIADLFGQLFFGYKIQQDSFIESFELFHRYLGDIECINPFILWTCTSVIAGLALSIAPLVGSSGIIGLCILFAIHAFFLAAPNALGNVIMIEVVGMHRYPMAYGFSLLASGSTSLVGYPLLGE